MTEEEKINWIKNASNEQLLKQYKSSISHALVCADRGDMIGEIEFNEDAELAMKEILKRMNGGH